MAREDEQDRLENLIVEAREKAEDREKELQGARADLKSAYEALSTEKATVLELWATIDSLRMNPQSLSEAESLVQNLETGAKSTNPAALAV